MTHMTRYASVTLSADVIFRDLEGEAVLLDLASGRYFGLNPVGTRVWTLLASGATVDAAIAALAAEFDADAGQIARDVEALLTEMIARGLVTAAPPGSRP
jgi:hypothetical protein